MFSTNKPAIFKLYDKRGGQLYLEVTCIAWLPSSHIHWPVQSYSTGSLKQQSTVINIPVVHVILISSLLVCDCTVAQFIVAKKEPSSYKHIIKWDLLYVFIIINLRASRIAFVSAIKVELANARGIDICMCVLDCIIVRC